MNFSTKIFFIGLFTIIGVLSSCNNEVYEIEDAALNSDFLEASKDIPSRKFNTAFDGKLYSISSAFQSKNLFNSSIIPFDSSLLYIRKKTELFPDHTFQALHLGFYYADILYITSCSLNKNCVSNLQSMHNLVNHLELSSIITPLFSESIHRNIGNNDSLLYVLNNQFSKFHYYLKENEKKNISVLILTGTWLKSMFIATQLFKESKSDNFIQHIGQQKQNLETIIALVEKYNNAGQNDKYIVDFNKLNELFEKVELSYEFTAPEIDVKSKTTSIKNKVTIESKKETIFQIKEQIAQLYTKIITL